MPTVRRKTAGKRPTKLPTPKVRKGRQVGLYKKSMEQDIRDRHAELKQPVHPKVSAARKRRRAVSYGNPDPLTSREVGVRREKSNRKKTETLRKRVDEAWARFGGKKN